MRLWDTGAMPLDQAILDFTVGDDPVLDREIVAYDCLASWAHATMLCEVGLLENDDLASLKSGLKEAHGLAENNRFEITQEQEDCHTALEGFLTEKCGDAGKRIHTGRSRNDQVIAAVRLMTRHRVMDIVDGASTLAKALAELADQHRTTLMPGYTHTRQGMPSTVGQLLGSYAEGVARDLEAFEPALRMANRGAMGSASGYGVPLPFKRDRVSELLGLDGTDTNTIYIQNTRGRLEALVLMALHGLSLTLGRLSSDLVWFSSEAFGFFKLPLELTTGSSIMPQKRNPDLFELARALPSSLMGRYTEVMGLLHGLPAGYHRDLQRTKGPMLRGMADVRSLLAVLTHAAEKLEVDKAAVEGSLRPEIYATDRVYAQVRDGVPFRDAYREVKKLEPEMMSKAEVLEPRLHLGAPGTEQLGSVEAILSTISERYEPYRAGHATALSSLLG